MINNIYLENHELEQLDGLLKYAAKDTIEFWIRTRIKGSSASMAMEGNISNVLLFALDDKLGDYLERIEEL